MKQMCRSMKLNRMSREVIVQRIEKSDLIDAKKELMIEIVQNKKEDDFDKKIDRLYRQFSKSSSFKKTCGKDGLQG